MEATDLGAYQRWLGAGEKNWEILREGRFGQGFSDGFSPESGPGMCWEDVFFFFYRVTVQKMEDGQQSSHLKGLSIDPSGPELKKR